MSSDTSGKPTITGLVLTYNGERLLGKCLESLAFCDAVIVVDSFSSDATESIAREHGATFVQHPWSGALPQFEYALGLVETDWVVSLDQDEICSEPLRDAILAALPGAPADLCGFTPARRSWYYDRFPPQRGPLHPERRARAHRPQRAHAGTRRRHPALSLQTFPGTFGQDQLLCPAGGRRSRGARQKGRPRPRRAARHDRTRAPPPLWPFYAFLKYVRVDEGNWGFPYNHR